MAVVLKTNLRRFREELTSPKVSQESLARASGVSLQWYRKLENGQQHNTSYTTATAILAAFNTERATRQINQLSLEQLDLHIV